jgi:hypothetical protein
MNEMDLLTRMRDNAPRSVSPRAEQKFRAGLYDKHPKRSRPTARRLVLVGVPTLAAAAAAALLVAVLPSGAHPRPRPAAAPLTAQLLADRAADAALSGPAFKPGQWVYEKYLLVTHATGQESFGELWMTADDSAQAGYINGKLYFQYNGSQNLAALPSPTSGPYVPIGFFDIEELSYSALGSLRGDPRALISRLGKLGAQLPGPVVGCAESSKYCDAFAEINQLFAGYMMPGKVAAELFHTLADIPGVSVVADVPAAGGQRGVAFRLRLTTGYQELILNPSTYQPMGRAGATGLVDRELVSGPGVRP